MPRSSPVRSGSHLPDNVVDQPDDVRPVPLQPFVSRAAAHLAVGLQHAAEHAVQRGLLGAADHLSPELAQVHRHRNPVRNVTFRGLHDVELGLPHAAFQFGERGGECLFVVPHVRAVQRARPAELPRPHHGRRPEDTLESEEPPVGGAETRGAAQCRELGGEVGHGDVIQVGLGEHGRPPLRCRPAAGSTVPGRRRPLTWRPDMLSRNGSRARTGSSPTPGAADRIARS